MENSQHSQKSNKKGYRIIFLVSLAFSILFECLIFMHSQINRMDSVLRQDFRIILIKNQSYKADISENIRKLKGVKNAVFVSSSDTINRIKSEDKELYYAVSAIGRNPVPDIYEVEIEDAALGNIDAFVEEAMKIKGVEDVKYKILESYAMLHFAFYSNFIGVILSLVLLMSVLVVITGMAHVGFANFFTSLKSSMKWFLSGALGSACAVVFVYMVIYPVKYLSPVWEWPAYYWHLIVAVICGLIGWVFYQWKKS